PAYVRVVASQSQDARVAHQVKTAVSDVRKIKPMAAEDQGGARGAHAMKGGMPLCIVLDTGVSGGKRLDQSGLWIVAESVIIDFAYRLNRHAAGFLAALVSAHAVSDDCEPSLALEFRIAGGLPIEVGILIVI